MLRIAISVCKFSKFLPSPKSVVCDLSLIQQNVRAKKSIAFEANMHYVLNTIRQLLTCSNSRASVIYDKYPSIRSIDMMSKVKINIELLTQNGISSGTIIENPFLLIMKEGNIIETFYKKLELN